MNTIVFSERLKETRLNQRLTQAELGKKAGVTSATISAYESTDETKRKNPSLENALKLANALDVSLDWLCGNDSNIQNGKTESFLMALMDLIFSDIRVELDNNFFERYHSVFPAFSFEVPPSCKLFDYLNHIIELKDIADKNVLTDDMLNTLKETAIDKYKEIDLNELIKGDYQVMPLEDD